MKYYQYREKKLNEIYRYSKIKKELKENERKENTPSGDISDPDKNVG